MSFEGPLSSVWQGVDSHREKEPLLAREKDTRSTRRCNNDTDNVRSWLVAFGLFLLNCIIFGLGRMASLLYTQYIDVFQVNRKAASAPYSLQMCLGGLLGPVTEIFGQLIGVSSTAALGGLVAAIGTATCYFVEDMEMIIVLWGGVYGVGSAMTKPLALILIDQYFVRYKSSAIGLISSAAPVGAIIFTPFLSIVLRRCGIPGTFLLMGSITLFTIPIVMLLREKPQTARMSAEQESLEISDKYSSLSGTEGSFDTNPKHDYVSDTEANIKYAQRHRFHSDTDVPEILPEEYGLKETSSSTCREKDLIERMRSSKMTHGRSNSQENVEGIAAELVKYKDEYSPKALKEPVKENEKSVSITFTESKSSESSNVESSMELSRKSNKSFEKLEPPMVGALLKDSENFQKDLSSSLAAEASVKKSGISKKDNAPTNSKKRKSFAKIRSLNALKYEGTTFSVDDPAIYENSVDFAILYENNDLVVDLLTNKVPLDDEIVMPSSSEFTQSNLESSDSQFIFKELQRIENNLQLSAIERQKVLIEIQKKLARFNKLLKADREEFLKQEDLDFKGRELIYKDIRNTTVKKPDCTLEITEYSFEIPVELYIPVKLQELNESSSAYVASRYSGDKRIFEVLKQLKKLHEIFNKPCSLMTNPPRNCLLQSKHFSELSNQNTSINQIEARGTTFKKFISSALNIYINPMFLLVCLCSGLTMLTFVPVVTSVVDFTMDKGMMRSDQFYAVAALSAGDAIGRFCTGWIIDKQFISNKNYMILALLLLSASTVSLPLISGIKILLPALGIFAALQGSLCKKHSVILLTYLRDHEKKIGLGSVSVFSGIIGLTIPFYIGYFRDQLGSYDRLYYINGSLCGFAGLLWICEPFLSNFVPAIREERCTEISSFFKCT